MSYRLNDNHSENTKICLIIDVLRCYEGLGHPTTFTTPEGVALLIFLDKMLGNKEITSFDMTQSLFNNVSTFCFLQNSEKISYSFHKNNDGSCNVAIEEHDSFHSYNEFTHFYIKNTEDVDELSHSIYCLLLDAGLFNSDTYFRQYLNRL